MVKEPFHTPVAEMYGADLDIPAQTLYPTPFVKSNPRWPLLSWSSAHSRGVAGVILGRFSMSKYMLYVRLIGSGDVVRLGRSGTIRTNAGTIGNTLFTPRGVFMARCLSD